jgi:hypothetical protein
MALETSPDFPKNAGQIMAFNRSDLPDIPFGAGKGYGRYSKDRSLLDTGNSRC